MFTSTTKAAGDAASNSLRCATSDGAWPIMVKTRSHAFFAVVTVLITNPIPKSPAACRIISRSVGIVLIIRTHNHWASLCFLHSEAIHDTRSRTDFDWHSGVWYRSLKNFWYEFSARLGLTCGAGSAGAGIAIVFVLVRGMTVDITRYFYSHPHALGRSGSSISSLDPGSA